MRPHRFLVFQCSLVVLNETSHLMENQPFNNYYRTQSHDLLLHNKPLKCSMKRQLLYYRYDSLPQDIRHRRESSFSILWSVWCLESIWRARGDLNGWGEGSSGGFTHMCATWPGTTQRLGSIETVHEKAYPWSFYVAFPYWMAVLGSLAAQSFKNTCPREQGRNCITLYHLPWQSRSTISVPVFWMKQS